MRQLCKIIIVVFVLQLILYACAESVYDVNLEPEANDFLSFQNNTISKEELVECQRLIGEEYVICDVDVYKDIVYLALTGEEGVSIVYYDGNGLEKVVDVSGEAAVKDFLVYSNRRLVVLRERCEQDKDLLMGVYRIEFYDEKGAIVQQDLKTGMAIGRKTNGNVLIMSSVNQQNCIFEMHDDSLQVIARNVYPAQQMLSANGILYYLSGDGLYCIDEEGQSQNVMMVSIDEEVNLQQDGEAIVCFETRTGSEVFRYTPNEGNSVLTLVNVEEGMRDARLFATIEELQRKYPYLQVKMLDVPEKQLKASLMAGEDRFDILYVSFQDTMELIEANVLRDLSEEELINETLEHWNSINEIIQWKEMKIGVPSLLFAIQFQQNDALKQYDNTKLDVSNCTWDEFFSAALEFQGDVNGDGHRELWYFSDHPRQPIWLDQYIAMQDPQTLTFDTDLFRSMAEQFKEVVQAGAMGDRMDRENVLYSSLCMFTGPKDAEEEIYIALPRIGDEAVNICIPRLFAVNRFSNQWDICKDFLMIYASAEVQSQRELMYLSDQGQYADYMESISPKAQERVSEKITLYGELIPSKLSEELTEYVIGDSLEQYCNDKISLDQLINQLDRNYHMYIYG